MELGLPAHPSGRQSWAPPAESPCWSSNTQEQRWARRGLPPPTSSFSVLLTLVNGSPIHPSDSQPRRLGSALTPLSHPPPQQVAWLFLQCTLEMGLLDCTGLSPVPFHSPSLVPLPPFLPSIHPIYSQHSSCECEPLKTHQTLSLLCSKPSSGPNFKVKTKV